MEGGGALSAEEQNLVVGDLVSQSHVGRHPMRLVHFWCRDFLPHVARDVVTLDGIHDSLLIHPAAESEDVIVLKDAKGSSSARNAHVSDELPLVLLRVVHFAVAVDLVAHEGSNDVDEVLNCANRVIGVRVVHVADLV